MKPNYLRKIGPFIILFYGVLIVYYYAAGYLSFLVNPVYNLMILICGLILIFIALGTAFKFSKNPSCDPSLSKMRTFLSIVLLILPLILCLVFKPQPLSSASALLRGVSSNIAVSDFNPATFAKAPEQRTLIEWVNILNIDPEPRHYQGQPVRIKGAIIMDEQLDPGSFYIGQFVLTCCAADAQSLALPVVYNPDQISLQNDRWVALEGEMIEGELDGNRQVMIKLSAIEYIPTPEDPYAKL